MDLSPYLRIHTVRYWRLSKACRVQKPYRFTRIPWPARPPCRPMHWKMIRNRCGNKAHELVHEPLCPDLWRHWCGNGYDVTCRQEMGNGHCLGGHDTNCVTVKRENSIGLRSMVLCSTKIFTLGLSMFKINTFYSLVLL